jgi:hypothetical protein
VALRIFEVDPESAPKSKFADDIVGRFRSGAQINGRPLALTEWRMTTGDPEVADEIVRLLGGEVSMWDTQSEETLEAYTNAPALDVIFDGPESVRTGMVLWGRNGMIRQCDGVTQQGDNPAPCVCPNTVKDRKDAAKAGHGCEPSVQLYFRLAAAPELGRFKFFSGSWSLAQDIGETEKALAKIGGPAKATLTLEKVEYTTRQGKEVSFTKPVVKVTGPAPAVDGEAI